MGAGLIYAIIIVMWAVVLVPMWIRRYEERRQSHSVDRFSAAMRSLARRPATAAGREVWMPQRESEPQVYRTENRPVRAPSDPVRGVAGPSLAERRRRTSLILLGSVMAVGGLALLGAVPGWLVLVPTVLLGAFVVHLRQEAQRDAARRARQRRQEKDLDARRDRAELAERAGQVRVSAQQRAQADAAVAPPAEPLFDRVAADEWQPVPVPLPTYVTAPKAPRSVRTIDLTHPGAYSAARHDETADPAAVTDDAAQAEPPAEQEQQPRRVVNG